MHDKHPKHHRASIYEAEIMSWSRRAGEGESVKGYTHCATLSNPLCGDRVTVHIRVDDGVVVSCGCQVRGCMLCKAASAHMATLIDGVHSNRLEEMTDTFKNALTGITGFPETHTMFAKVRHHKSRHSCVLLPYEAALIALSGVTESEST